MIRLDLQFELDYLVDSAFGDFLFSVQPARTAAQRVLCEQVTIAQDLPWRAENAPAGNRVIRVRAPRGPLHLSYAASVTIEHLLSDPATLEETPVDALPVDVLPYLMPSRYCESDRLGAWAEAVFGAMPPGHERVRAIEAWVRRHIAYVPGASTTRTSALDTMTDRVGVCRDMAHLMIALCRALSIPARYVTGTDFGADTARAPDFHAYVEAYVGRRWYLFDPSGTGVPMGFVRIGTGFDAAQVPFAMLFGEVRAPFAPWVRATACEGPGLELPRPVDQAISSDLDHRPMPMVVAANG
ncbi:transglutaminase-like domain-containing protein [Roseateles sp. So40a]|uniref:transglutaminase-like domain-containing protein n=1 Tax=Roseateles sp. So40a TaxID=3400226 RepID=UPI003A8A3D95